MAGAEGAAQARLPAATGAKLELPQILPFKLLAGPYAGMCHSGSSQQMKCTDLVQCLPAWPASCCGGPCGQESMCIIRRQATRADNTTIPSYPPNPDAQLGRARHGAGQARDVQHVQGAALGARFAPSCAAPAPVSPPPLLGRARAPPAPRSGRPLPRRSGPRVGQSLLRRRARPRAGTPGGGLAPGVRAPRQDGRTRRVDGRDTRWP